MKWNIIINYNILTYSNELFFLVMKRQIELNLHFRLLQLTSTLNMHDYEFRSLYSELDLHLQQLEWWNKTNNVFSPSGKRKVIFIQLKFNRDTKHISFIELEDAFRRINKSQIWKGLEENWDIISNKWYGTPRLLFRVRKFCSSLFSDFSQAYDLRYIIGCISY